MNNYIILKNFDGWEITKADCGFYNNQLVVRKFFKWEDAWEWELQRLKTLKDCPNVPNLISSDNKLIIMSYCGESLYDIYLKNNLEIPEDIFKRVIDLYFEIAGKYCLYHDDLSPGNITILNNKIYLIDWTLALDYSLSRKEVEERFRGRIEGDKMKEGMKQQLEKNGYVFIKDFYSEEEAISRYDLITAYWVKEFGNIDFKYHKSGPLLDKSLQHIIWHYDLIKTLKVYDKGIMWGGGCKIATKPIKTLHRDDTWKENINRDPFYLSNNGYYRLRVVQFISPVVNQKRIFKVIPGTHKSVDIENEVVELEITSRDIVIFHSILKHAGGEIPDRRFLMTTTYSSSSELAKKIYYRDAFRRYPQNMFTIDKELNEKLLELDLSPLVENHAEYFEEQKAYMAKNGFVNDIKDPIG